MTQVRCPLQVLHVDWHRFPNRGLVSAMNDDAVAAAGAAAAVPYGGSRPRVVVHRPTRRLQPPRTVSYETVVQTVAKR